LHNEVFGARKGIIYYTFLVVEYA